CKFDSNSSCVSSSVNNGEARNESEPTFALAADAGIAGISLTGFTLNRDPLQEAVSSASKQKPSRVAALEIGNVVRIILIELAGDLNRFGGCSHARSELMKLGRVDHVQALIAHRLKSWKNFIDRRVHDAFAAFVTGEIQIEMLAHEPIRHAGESIERILDSVAKQLASQTVIIERHAQRKFHIRG